MLCGSNDVVGARTGQNWIRASCVFWEGLAPATKCVPKVGGRGWRWRWARRAAAVAAADNAAPVWIVRQQDANVNRYCACIYVAVLVARLWRRGRAGALGLSLDRRARGVAQGGGQLDGPPTGGVAAPFSAPSLRDGAHCASTTARGNAKTALARPSRPASAVGLKPSTYISVQDGPQGVVRACLQKPTPPQRP